MPTMIAALHSSKNRRNAFTTLEAVCSPMIQLCRLMWPKNCDIDMSEAERGNEDTVMLEDDKETSVCEEWTAVLSLVRPGSYY